MNVNILTSEFNHKQPLVKSIYTLIDYLEDLLCLKGLEISEEVDKCINQTVESLESYINSDLTSNPTIFSKKTREEVHCLLRCIEENSELGDEEKKELIDTIEMTLTCA